MRTAVIIPMLNEQAGIAAAVASARDAGADQVIAVDGGSSDSTAAVAAAAGAEVVHAARGRAVQCNAGAEHASADILLFLHADCRLHPNAIEELRRRLQDDAAVIAGGFRQRIDDPRWRFRLLESGNALRVRWFGWVYGDQALFLRTSVFWQLGGFPKLPFMEDLFLSRQLVRTGRMALLSAPVTVSPRRWHRRGVVRQTCRNWILIALALCGVPPHRLARCYPNDR